MDLKNTAYYFAAFRKLLRSYTDYQLRELKDYNLTPNEIVVLSGIGSIGMASDIAASACVSKALVSRSVKQLKDKGLIKINISPPPTISVSVMQSSSSRLEVLLTFIKITSLFINFQS